MPRVMIRMQAEDAEGYLQRLPSRRKAYEMLTEQPVHYGLSDEGEVVLSLDVDDLSSFAATIQSQPFVEILAVEGIRRETAKVYILDKSFDPS